MSVAVKVKSNLKSGKMIILAAIVPCMIYYLIFYHGAMFYAFYLSFTNWQLGVDTKFVKLDNFVRISHCRQFILQIPGQHTVLYSLHRPGWNDSRHFCGFSHQRSREQDWQAHLESYISFLLLLRWSLWPSCGNGSISQASAL